MNVVWVESGLFTESAEGPSSPHAGVRYRALPAMRAMGERGHAARIVPVVRVESPEALLAGGVDLLACSRVVPPVPAAFADTANRYLACAALARQRGIGVLVDANDRHWDIPEARILLLQLAGKADVVVAGSAALAEAVGKLAGASVRVIGDPYEMARGAPAFDPPAPRRATLGSMLRRLGPGTAERRAVRLLWFGHPTNLGPVFALLPQLAPLVSDWSLELELVSGAGCGAEEVCAQVTRDFGPLLVARFTEWTPQAAAGALERCDLVVIPADVDAPGNAGKTANRVIESIRRGRFVVAHPLPSYLEFERFAWIGASIADGIAWALRHPGTVRRRLAGGQAHVEAAYSPAAIGALWERAMLDAAAAGGRRPR